MTYAQSGDIESIVTLLKAIAKDSAPPQFTYRAMEDLARIGSLPTGFSAQYGTRDGDITMVFLVLNLTQEDQRGAAKQAGRTREATSGSRKIKSDAAPKKAEVVQGVSETEATKKATRNKTDQQK